MRHLCALLRRAALPFLAGAALCANITHAAEPVDVQLAGQPVQAAHASSLMPPVHNIYGRTHMSLDGRRSYIVDPYENGYYDYRHMTLHQSATDKGHIHD